MPQFEFAILGAGAIGSIIGAHLARAGHSVVMLVRPRRAEQIAAQGLRIQGLAQFSVKVPTITDAAALDSARVLIVAMKTNGTRDALEPLRSTRIEVAFSIQNGMLKNELLAAVLGKERVLGALANTSGELLPDGAVLFTRNVSLLLGGFQPGSDSRAVDIAKLIDAAGVRSSAVPDILSREWSKFAAWVGFMMLSVTTRLPTWQYLTDPDAAALLVRLVREVTVLAKSQGIQLTDQSMLPVASMMACHDEQAVEVVRAAGVEYRTNAPAHRMSSLQDLDAGRGLELEGTLGHAVQLAKACGLQLPLLETSYRLVACIDRNRA
jgi:2-dehydropantoate 2-reductase